LLVSFPSHKIVSLFDTFSATPGYTLPGFVLLLMIQNLPVERFGTAGTL